MKYFSLVVVTIATLSISQRVGAILMKERLPVYASVPEFNLVDGNGGQFNSAQLNGEKWVGQFFFTSCPHICPLVTSKVAKIAEEFKDVDDVNFISITVDPDIDTPSALNKYSQRFNSNPEKWKFLTGSKEVINNLLTNVFFFGPLGDSNLHSRRLTLVDADQRIRGYYDTNSQDDMDKLVKDLANL